MPNRYWEHSHKCMVAALKLHTCVCLFHLLHQRCSAVLNISKKETGKCANGSHEMLQVKHV